MLLQTIPGDPGAKSDDSSKPELDTTGAHVLDYAPAPGWTVHVTNEGRLYYCNHVTRTAGWLPPAEAWKCGGGGGGGGEETLPYGWERAVDNSGRPYYINHVNKTTTYETPIVKNLDPAPIPEPRSVTLERSPALGFGFVAGSEKPVIVRFVTEGGPSVDKLLPGDQILSVNGEDVKMAPREHVISLVRACTKTVNLVVCQPPEQQGIRKSTLLSASKKARLKTKPSRVRFAESVCVNGAPLFPPSAFSLGDLCVAPMANVLKVFLENGQTKSFKYDAWTSVHDVVTSLESKLCLQATEHFSLVVEHIKSLKRNKLTLLDPSDTLARIASRPGAHKLRCLFRVAFVPPSAAALAQRDLNALDYLYTQCCNDVIQERFAPELQYDTALRLAALHIYQHALVNNIPATKLTVKTIEREFGLDRFVPASLLDTMKRKEVRKLISHFLKLHSNMAGAGKQLTSLQAKLHYLDIVAQLPSYGAKCFSAGPKADALERVILVSPKFGLSQITGTRNSMVSGRGNNEWSIKNLIIPQPVPIANIEDMRRIEVRSDDEVTKNVLVRLANEKTVSISLEERDASELVLVLRGYFRLVTGQVLPVDQDEAPPMEDLAPPYLSQHKVVPEKWSYLNQTAMKTACFTILPTYQTLNKKTNGLYNTMGRQSKPLGYSLDNNMNNSLSNRNHFDTYDLETVVSMELLENGRGDEVLKRVAEMHQLVENSEKYLRLNSLEWQETSVDIESENEDSIPGQLKHSDSLLLLNKSHAPPPLERRFANAAIELLRSESNQSESDNDSLYTPHDSPKHRIDAKANRVSFGLRSPDEKNEAKGEESVYVFDPDIIDLTLLPPPATPDELDCALPTPINVPPSSFADSVEKLNRLDNLNEDQDLEEFLASVTVPPPTQKVTPAIELTPEEIMSYIIPPPPVEITEDIAPPIEPKRRNSNVSIKSNIIEYATVDRKGAFSSCCGKTKKDEQVRPLPRRSSDEKPPERPPKNLPQERQRSQSLTTKPPKLPPRGEAPPHLFLPPKKPPLPPVPPLEVLRQKKNQQVEVRTAGIGSPHLQRSRLGSDLDMGLKVAQTAVSTPTSPHLGRGAQLTAVPIMSPDSPTQKNGCTSTRELLLAKTDVAMASLLVRLDQVAAQCSAAQVHGGGRLISEEKFQIAKEELTSQSLQLVTSSKMLVIAMSDPSLPDLPENLAICLTILRRLTELCQDLTNHTTAPLQTRNLILKVHDVTAAFRHLITSHIDRTSPKTIEEHLAAQAESLANVLATLLRSLRVFSP
ncbi:uncharacterized protein LOC123010031 isoform X1 [Tribolium madens]|uniref:uncharacterized protein LOC123010031 isoform X1 n=1 Tax=Tribolium madens TaxID=41895 RepID=UPI001CF761E5|nr:uncharacterized protein LOC123010031 isoform X1 [Tribolium madens]XP_044262586.1 uncharacterized protein LOC123010031 isoform X1 [Tribolium madens]